MKRGLSVIITIRGEEPHLARTIHNVRQAAGCPVEIITVYDGQMNDDVDADQVLVHLTPRGIGPSRDRGIKAAKYAVVILIDAHMNFEPGFGQKILDHFRLKKNAKDVTCGRCIPSLADLSPEAGNDGYAGARFSLKSEESGGEKWCLSGKWSDQEVNSEIGCVFGACYAFRRAWYEELGSPLLLLSGWWGDEEYLSIASWLAGGRCYLLDYWASHLFRDQPSFKWERTDWMKPTANRSRLIDLFPCEDGLKAELIAWHSLSLRTADAEYIAHLEADRRRPEVKTSKKLWKTWSENVPVFLEKWVDAEAAPLIDRLEMREAARPWKKTTEAPALAAPVAPRVQSRSYIVCPNCGQRESFRVSRTLRAKGEIRRYGRCANFNCKNRGVMVDREGGQVVYWGKDAALYK